MKQFKIKKFSWLFFLGTLLFISGCNVTNSSLIEIGNQELASVLESTSGYFVYIGRPTCPACEEFEPILEESLSELSKELYYFNTDEARQENEEQMLALLEPLEVVSVPTIIYIEDGEVIGRLNGLHTEIEVIEFFETYGRN